MALGSMLQLSTTVSARHRKPNTPAHPCAKTAILCDAQKSIDFHPQPRSESHVLGCARS
jgi:hypothetical protein